MDQATPCTRFFSWCPACLGGVLYLPSGVLLFPLPGFGSRSETRDDGLFDDEEVLYLVPELRFIDAAANSAL